MSAFSPRPAATPSSIASNATFGHGTNTAALGRSAAPGIGNTGISNSSQLQTSSVANPDLPTHVIEGPSGRILCVADIRGNLKNLNQLAAQHNASAIIHTGDFGFYNNESLDRISDRTLRHLVQYSALIPQDQRNKLLSADPVRGPASAGNSASAANMRAQMKNSSSPLLSEFPLLLNGQLKLNVPVFCVWGSCEDIAIVERFRAGEYKVPNLQILDEATTRAIEVGGIKLRLFGLGGAVVMHKLFDNGEGLATIAGGQGTMWTTMLQIGELVDTAQKTFDPSETRLLITHASSGREGLLAQLALAVRADVTLSAGLHFRYGVSYNEFSVQHETANYRNKLAAAKTAFTEVWENVKSQVEEAIDDQQRTLLNLALAVTNRVPPLSTATGAASEEIAWKNTWNWNLPDAEYGALLFDIKDGRLGATTISQGFNFAYRRGNAASAASTIKPASTAHAPVAPSPSTGFQAKVPFSSNLASQQSASNTSVFSGQNRTGPGALATPPGRQTHLHGVKSPAAAGANGSGSATPAPVGPGGVKSPPLGPKGHKFNSSGSNHAPRQPSGAATPHTSVFASSSPGGPRGAGNAGLGGKDSDNKGKGKPDVAAIATSSGPAAAAVKQEDAPSGSSTPGSPATKPAKKSRGGKNKKSGLANASAEDGEVTTSGNESGNGNNNKGQQNKKAKKEEAAAKEGAAAVKSEASPATPVTAGETGGSTDAASPATGGEEATPGSKEATSSGAASGVNTPSGRGRGGRGRGAFSRGHRSGRGSRGGSTSGASAGASSPAPPPPAPAATS